MQECLELLKKAREILSDHWFSDGGYYNNEEVIAISKEIDVFLDKIEKPHKDPWGKQAMVLKPWYVKGR